MLAIQKVKHQWFRYIRVINRFWLDVADPVQSVKYTKPLPLAIVSDIIDDFRNGETYYKELILEESGEDSTNDNVVYLGEQNEPHDFALLLDGCFKWELERDVIAVDDDLMEDLDQYAELADLEFFNLCSASIAWLDQRARYYDLSNSKYAAKFGYDSVLTWVYEDTDLKMSFFIQTWMDKNDPNKTRTITCPLSISCTLYHSLLMALDAVHNTEPETMEAPKTAQALATFGIILGMSSQYFCPAGQTTIVPDEELTPEQEETYEADHIKAYRLKRYDEFDGSDDSPDLTDLFDLFTE